MPNLRGVLIAPSGRPVEIAFKVGAKDNIQDLLQPVIGCATKPVATSCSLGVLFTTPEPDTVPNTQNALATRIRQKFSSHLPKEVGLTHGRVVVLGENKEGATVSVDKSSVQQVIRNYEEMTGHSLSGGKRGRRRVGPKKNKRAYDYFASDFQRSRRAEKKEAGEEAKFAEITKEAFAAWGTYTDEQKAPYEAKAEEDRKRYEAEMKQFRIDNPPAPTKRRNAYNMYCKEFKDRSTRPPWKTLSDEQKAPYLAKAEEDKVRYEREMEAFRKHCEETGKNFEELTARKRRKESGESQKKKKAKTNTSKAKKTTKPKKKAGGKKGKKKADPSPEPSDEDTISEDESGEDEE